MSKNYLVTGGTGFIGAAIVKRLLDRGDNVRVLDNNSRGAERRLSGVINDVDIRVGDIRDFDLVNEAVHGIDCVLHLAYVNGTKFFYEKPELVLDVGVKGMINVLDACKNHDVSELVLASSSEVYQTPPSVPTKEDVPMSVPDPLNPRYSYGGGKIISELMTLNYGRDAFDRTIIFRPHNVYGPDMGFEHVIPEFSVRMRDLKNSSEPYVFQIQGDGSVTRSFIYIDDFCDGIETMLDSGHHMQIYNIGTEDEITIKELANYVADYFDVSITLSSNDLPAGGTNRRCPDIAKLQALGFLPSTSVKEGLAQTIPWYVNN